jgi:hypothetical protein
MICTGTDTHHVAVLMIEYAFAFFLTSAVIMVIFIMVSNQMCRGELQDTSFLSNSTAPWSTWELNEKILSPAISTHNKSHTSIDPRAWTSLAAVNSLISIDFFCKMYTAERLRLAYPALLERACVGLIPSNSDAQNVPSFRRWRFEMKLSPFCTLLVKVKGVGS